MPRRFVFILCVLFLAACQAGNGIVSQPAPTIDLLATKTAAAGTAITQLMEETNPTAAVQTALARVTVTPSPNATVKPWPTDKPYPTELPPIAPSLLKTNLMIQPETFNGHTIQRITGWDYGFTGYEWLDEKHLLLSAVTGPKDTFGQALNYPGIINLATQKVWLPLPVKTGPSGALYPPLLPRWSAQLGLLIAAEDGNSVGLFSSDGELIKTYLGNLLGVSPSTTKILIDNRWIDLSNGRTVTFDWQQSKEITDQYYIRPIWSPDETRIYACCYLYGDAKTGNSVVMPIDRVTVDGQKVDSNLPFYHFYGTWTLNGAYLLVQPQGVFDSSLGFVPLFDPAKQTYRNLNSVAGISDFQLVYYATSALPGGQYVWITDASNGYLVDLATFKARTYPGLTNTNIFWSADGQFAWLSSPYTSSRQVLSVASQNLKPVPGNCGLGLEWHPTDNLLFCESGKEQTISLLEARTLAVQAIFKPVPADCSFSWSATGDGLLCLSTKEKALWLLDGRKLSVQKKVALPVEFQNLIGSPGGKRIALLARDSSLWQIDYPTFENLEQLTPAMPKLTHPAYGRNIDESLIKNVVWSPDGASLAFIGDTDIYIVDTQVRP